MSTCCEIKGNTVPVKIWSSLETVESQALAQLRTIASLPWVFVTRKGAISARAGELGIIPGSMGTASYIVRGLGNPESFCSAPHGAGRRMSRGAAKRSFSVADLEAQTAGVECRKDTGVLDEIPGAYKDIDTVMSNSDDLVQIVTRLKQVLCVKG
jgi:tRNA-splicing ligase RtcB